MSPSEIKTLTIANGASLSDAINCGASRAVRLIMPAAWTPADLTVQTSIDGVDFNNLHDVYGTEYTIRASSSRSILLPLADFLGITHMKLRSGTNGTPVPQGAAREIKVVLVG